AATDDADALTRLSSALDELEVTDPGLARVVDLRFFGGFSFAAIASMMAVSERTVQRDWQKARIYLHQVLRNDTSLAGCRVFAPFFDLGVGHLGHECDQRRTLAESQPPSRSSP